MDASETGEKLSLNESTVIMMHVAAQLVSYLPTTSTYAVYLPTLTSVRHLAYPRSDERTHRVLTNRVPLSEVGTTIIHN